MKSAQSVRPYFAAAALVGLCGFLAISGMKRLNDSDFRQVDEKTFVHPVVTKDSVPKEFLYDCSTIKDYDALTAVTTCKLGFEK